MAPSGYKSLKLNAVSTFNFDSYEAQQLARSTKPFTMIVSGRSVKCPDSQRCTTDDFTSINCDNHHVWLQPDIADVNDYLNHYFRCKHANPDSTSAVIVLPKHLKHDHTRLFKKQHLQLLREFPAGTCVVADSSGQLQPLKHRLQAWYDAPIVLQSGSLLDPEQEHIITSNKDCMEFTGAIGGSKCRITIDTGASHNFISSSFVQQAGIAVTPCKRTVALADGKQVAIVGVCTAHLKLGTVSDVVHCYVLKLSDSYDVLLGAQWLKQRKAVLRFSEGALIVRKAKGTTTIAADPIVSPDTGGGESSTQPISKRMLSTIQLKRAVRKGGYMFLAVVQKDDGEERPANAQPQQGCDGLIPIPKLDALLAKHKAVFTELPGGYVKRPGVPDMSINLRPGESPPVGVTYRLSHPEYLECQRVLKEGLEKGLIDPSSSPFGAPVLFVKKPRSTALRFCCDYRALNNITIRDRNPLPRVDDLIDRLKGATVFSGLDLQSGYHQLFIAEEDRHKTAFRTPFGAYQWRVIPFGLTNAPSVFMRAMTHVFQDMIGKFVHIYLDDILVYSKTPEEHEAHLEAVLTRLAEYQLYARLEKCNFNMPEVLFLGHMVGRDGIRVDPRKIEIVRSWPTPKTQSELRSFLGLANYFRRFVHAYSSIAKPLHALTGKTQWSADSWTSQCQESFDLLKGKLTTAPTLAMPDFSDTAKSFQIIADASNTAIGAILLQDDQPIAFESKRLTPAECRYDTTEREVLAVIHALTIWRCYIDQRHVFIYSDHEPLRYLRTKPSLTPRQVRWSQFLETFDYTWEFRQGKLNAADPLSRAPHCSMTGCTPSNLAGTNTVGPVDAHLAAITRETLIKYPPPPLTAQEKHLDWLEAIKAAYKHDSALAALQRKDKVIEKGGIYYQTKNQSLIYVPASLRLPCLEQYHDTPYSGHKGTAKTAAAIQKSYWWPGITTDIAKYVKTCLLCQRNKASTKKPAGLLQPLEVPADRWSEVTMDFITGLPCTPGAHDAIMVVCDRLTKFVRFIPCTKDTDTPDVARLFIKHVFAEHGMPERIITDRDTRFTSQLWQDLQQQLGCKHKLSTSFHPQTDGQTERVNRVLEEYLRHYVNSTQSDWDSWLPLAQFAYNNSWHEAIGTTPFYMNYLKHPTLPHRPTGPAKFPVVGSMVTTMDDIVRKAKSRLEAARQRAKSYADKHRSDLALKIGQEVMLSTRFIQLKVPGVNKLLPKYVGPFKISKVVNNVAYKLALPDCMRCHPVFHVSLLKPYHQDGRHQPAPPPFEFDEEEGLWYEIDGCLEHRTVRRGRKSQLQYLVSFKGHDASHNQWCDAEGVTILARNEYHDLTGTTPTVQPTTAPRQQNRNRVSSTITTPTQPTAVSRSGRSIIKRVRFQ